MTIEFGYIRIGEIPKNEISNIYDNYVKVGEEIGVSAYEAIKINNSWHIIFPPDFRLGQGDTYEKLLRNVVGYDDVLGKPRKVYLISGDVVGKGSDGEPLLKNVRIKEDITNQFISNFY